MKIAKTAVAALSVIGVSLLLAGAGCLGGGTSAAQDAPLQGTWSTTNEEFGAGVTMGMTFNNGAWEFATSFEPSQELIDSLADVEPAEGEEAIPEIKAESMTFKANYAVDSVENNVFQLTLTGFTADASSPELLEDFDATQVETEMGKLEVSTATEGEIVVKPQGGTEADEITLKKQ